LAIYQIKSIRTTTDRTSRCDGGVHNYLTLVNLTGSMIAVKRLYKETVKMAKEITLRTGRANDPYVDRRSGEDRRGGYDLDYFPDGGTERRSGKERRRQGERRDSCIRVSDWSSVCPDDAS
jgi:hypothetical protein